MSFGMAPRMNAKEIGLCVQNKKSIIGSVVDIMGEDLYNYLTSTRTFTSRMNKILIRASKFIWRKVDDLELVLLTILR